MAIFRLMWGTYDGDTNYYFEGPEVSQEEFVEVCNQLMREACRDFLDGDENQTWLGYMNLVDEVARRLPSRGFQRTELKAAEYIHGMILRVPGDDYSGDHQNVLGPELESEAIKWNEDFEQRNRKRLNKVLGKDE